MQTMTDAKSQPSTPVIRMIEKEKEQTRLQSSLESQVRNLWIGPVGGQVV
jgi:hypothetical protein